MGGGMEAEGKTFEGGRRDERGGVKRAGSGESGKTG